MPLRRPALDLTVSLRLGILGPRTYGHTTLEEGESAWLALSWKGDAPTTLDEAEGQREATEKYWRTGSRWPRSTTTCGVPTSNAARSR